MNRKEEQAVVIEAHLLELAAAVLLEACLHILPLLAELQPARRTCRAARTSAAT